MAKTVRIVRSGGSIWNVRVNGRTVSFAGNVASPSVASGEHTIQFFVRGPQLSGYSLEITSPPEAKLKFEGTFDALQKDQGSGWFHVV